MCNVICVNTKCDRILPNGFCGRAYPCSECQIPYDIAMAKEVAEVKYQSSASFNNYNNPKEVD